MLTFITIVHILLAVALVCLVLLQDSKGGAMGFTGGGSNQILSTTNAANFLVKATRTVAILFAATSIALTWFTSHRTSSVTDAFAPPVAQDLAKPADTKSDAATPTDAKSEASAPAEAAKTQEAPATVPATTTAPEKK